MGNQKASDKSKRAMSRPTSERWKFEGGYDSVCKVVLIGDAGVGKSSLIHRFTENTHCTTHVPTIGVDFKIKSLTQEGRVTKLHLWDTTGNERFRSITTAYYRAAHGIVICFDTTNATSFERVREWLSAVEQFAGNGVSVMLIGTKTDLREQRQVPRERAEAFAASKRLSYAETSSVRDENVRLVFETMTRAIARRQAEMSAQRRNSIRTAGGSMHAAIAEWRPTAVDSGCCSCLPFFTNMTRLLANPSPPATRWSPVSTGPALTSVEVG